MRVPRRGLSTPLTNICPIKAMYIKQVEIIKDLLCGIVNSSEKKQLLLVDNEAMPGSRSGYIPCAR